MQTSSNHMRFVTHLLHSSMDARLQLALCSFNITAYESGFADNLDFVASSLYSGQHRHLYNVGNDLFVHGNVRTLPVAMQVNLRRLSCIHGFETYHILQVFFFSSNP